MDMDIWVVGTSTQLFITGSYTETNFSKAWSSYWQNSVFCDKHFVPLILFVLTLASERAVLYQNVSHSILVLSTKKRHSSFLKKFFVFQKICFKVELLKRFEISRFCGKSSRKEQPFIVDRFDESPCSNICTF